MAESMRERFASTAGSLLDDETRAAVVLADISVSSFAGAVRRHPDRVINVGIREQTQIGVAAGLALGRPLADAVEGAKRFVHRAMANAPGLGGGHGPLNHFVAPDGD